MNRNDKPKAGRGRIGSDFEEWLKEERLIDGAYAKAKARVEAWRDKQPDSAAASDGPPNEPQNLSGPPRKPGGKGLSRNSI
jgi:hypothetical protein